MSTNTSRSLALLRKAGCFAEVVERYIPGAGVRKDLFGFIDIVAISPRNDKGRRHNIFVQTTSYGNVSARVNKIVESPFLDAVREAGNQIIVHGWHKVGRFWQARVVDLS